MHIRLANLDDFETILKILEYGKAYQKKNGNNNQWGANFPDASKVKSDIETSLTYVCLVEDEIVGTFMLLPGDNPDFSHLPYDTWLNNEPYITIHRVASNGKVRGVGTFMINWVKERFNNIKVYTHEDNTAMIRVFEKCGFTAACRFNNINGHPRIGFQYYNEKLPKIINSNIQITDVM